MGVVPGRMGDGGVLFRVEDDAGVIGQGVGGSGMTARQYVQLEKVDRDVVAELPVLERFRVLGEDLVGSETDGLGGALIVDGKRIRKRPDGEVAALRGGCSLEIELRRYR